MTETANTPTAAAMMDRLERNSGRHPGYRRLQARGICCQGVFTPSNEAAEYTTAAHLQGGPVPVTVRFSAGETDPAVPDTARVIRSLAVRFHLPQQDNTDLLAVSLPVFLAPTAEDFYEMLDAVRLDPVTGGLDPARVGAYIGKHPQTAAAFGAIDTAPPASYATLGYSALHAYIWVNKDGLRQPVRYTWDPDEKITRLSDEELADRGPHYLTEEIHDRLSRGTAAFSLRVQLAAEGDPTHDSTIAWPDHRKMIVAGRLELTSVVDDPDSRDAYAFDPTRLTSGIELSDDSLLHYRKTAYAESHRRRATEGR
ncbi:catalase family peroxidase [Micromonospora sp. DH14]|uniref:catalase family peroxidase n=1 Tax=Micromonospora sp. DH14 TaxID=3040120 RepID=UPI0024426935|nr:catalase family peroxidase [Micromonospora sp. DH14]MDG9675862.1 catalase family peroxidase [Micromonospora sp. DH14]